MSGKNERYERYGFSCTQWGNALQWTKMWIENSQSQYEKPSTWGVSHSATESRLKSWSFSQTHGFSQGRIGYGSRYGFLLATFHEALPRRISKPRIIIILGVLVFHHLHFRAHEVAVSQALQPIFTANRFRNLASELARSRFLPDPSVALPAPRGGVLRPQVVSQRSWGRRWLNPKNWWKIARVG